MANSSTQPTDAERSETTSTDPQAARWDARLVLAVGIALGLVGVTATVARHPGLVGIDLKVYYAAAEAALAGEDFYAAAPAAHPSYGYVYPPVTIPAFYPLALLGSWQAAFGLLTVLNLAAAVATAALLVDLVERHRGSSPASDRTPLPWADRTLVAGFVALSLHSMSTLLYGEVNLLLVLALTAGLYWLDAGQQRRAGVALAIPAVVKLFPAFVGAWLLRRRAWTAVAAATATGVGLLALGVAAFGVEPHVTWVDVAIRPRLSSAEFAGGLDAGATMVTLRRPLSVLVPSLAPGLHGPLAFLLLAPVVAYCYRRVETAVDRLVGTFATLAAMVIGFPSLLLYVVYLLVPLVGLLLLLERGPARRLVVAGAFVSNFAVTLANVETAVAASPIPAAVLDVAAPLLTFATPPLYGVTLALAGCVVHAHRRPVS